MKRLTVFIVILFLIAGFSSVNLFSSETEAEQKAVASDTTQLNNQNTDQGIEGEVVAVNNHKEVVVDHGSWHPCANDPNACGAGHVCCEGHCFYGQTCP